MKHRDIGLVSRQTQMIACMLIAVAVIGAMTVAITKSNKNIRNRKNVDYSEEANSH